MTRQHAAEKFGLKEGQRPIKLQREANRIAAQTNGYQGMASQQKAAHKSIQLNRHAGGVRPPKSANPAEAARAYQEIAKQEHSRRAGIREGLNAQRQSNQLRAMTADRFRARAGRGKPMSAGNEPSPQEQARQAVQSGRALTGDERANAAPELKERLARQDRRIAKRATFAHGEGNQRQQDKGRGGGGRGR